MAKTLLAVRALQKGKRVVALGLTCLALGACPPVALATPINGVQVHIADSKGGTSRTLLDKMESSMQVVAQQLFVNKQQESVDADREGYARLLGEIADRVLTGYQTDRVQIATGSEAIVQLTVTPWAEVIHRPRVDLQFSGMGAENAAYLQEQIPGLTAEVQSILEGSALDAADWSQGVVRSTVRSRLEQTLPDFKAAVDVTNTGNNAGVQVIIYPVGELVRTVRYEMLSRTIPNVLLMELKYRYANKMANLRGMPVSYLTSHCRELEQELTERLLQEPEVKRHNLVPTITIKPGADLEVGITLESTEYRIWFEGYGDIGRREHDLSGRAHLGKNISGKDELFGEVGLDLKEVKWDFSGGYARHQGKATLSYARRAPTGENIYRLGYDISPKWQARYEYFSGNGAHEYGLRYRIHEFLSGEYVYSTEKSYFRIIGNL